LITVSKAQNKKTEDGKAGHRISKSIKHEVKRLNRKGAKDAKNFRPNQVRRKITSGCRFEQRCLACDRPTRMFLVCREYPTKQKNMILAALAA